MKIKYLVMDVDGTLTDGKIYMGNEGEVFKAFNVKDGYGINEMARLSGIESVIITGRTSKIVENRCKELNISILHQGVRDKLAALLEVTDDLSQVAYIGDDLNDLSVMEAVKAAGGVIGCPMDAHKKVVDSVDYISAYAGGNGAVRDFIEWLLN